MAVLVAHQNEVQFRSEPHRWQTSLSARIVRRIGRRWVIARHVQAYCRPLAISGGEQLAALRGPAIIIANHSSHFDTPVVLTALPGRIRAKTAVGAAADRFYRRDKRTWWFSLFFNTFPIVRGGGSATLAYARELLGRAGRWSSFRRAHARHRAICRASVTASRSWRCRPTCRWCRSTRKVCAT